MKFGYFSQLQMPKPWRENGEILLYKEAMEQAIHAELATLMAAFSKEKLEDGRARLVRHGHLPEREVMTGIGPVPVKVPRVRDRGAGDACCGVAGQQGGTACTSGCGVVALIRIRQRPVAKCRNHNKPDQPQPSWKSSATPQLSKLGATTVGFDPAMQNRVVLVHHCSMAVRSSSLRTATPRLSALVSLLPAASPATT